MKYITFEYNKTLYPGVCRNGRVFSLRSLGYDAPTLEAFITGADGTEHAIIRGKLESGSLGGIPLSEVRLHAPIPEPRQEIIIMQNNYKKTASEAQAARARIGEPDYLPTYYYKKATLAGEDGGAIPRYKGFLEQLDAQAELCAVLMGDIYRCPIEDAHRRIFGYVVINNVIAHDVTVRHRRPYISTGLDGFLPMSPYIVSADEFEEGHCFKVRSYVNGQPLQNGSTDERVFSPEYAIADISRTSVLYGGTILSTGTPFGTLQDVGGPFLEPGDVVRCEVEGVGSVTSTVV